MSRCRTGGGEKEEILSRTDGGKSATGQDAVGDVGGEREGGLIIAWGGVKLRHGKLLLGTEAVRISWGRLDGRAKSVNKGIAGGRTGRKDGVAWKFGREREASTIFLLGVVDT